jgi:hypothetical protein
MKLKNKLISFAAAGIISLASCNSNNLYSTKRSEALARADIKKFVDIKDVRDYVEFFTDYQPEFMPSMIDFWKSPKKTLEDKGGDCDDKAILMAYLCQKLGYQPKIMSVAQDRINSGHVYTLLERKCEDGKIRYGALDSNTILYPEYDSLEKLIGMINIEVSQDYVFYKVYDLNKISKDWANTDKNLKQRGVLRFGFDKIK